MNGIFQKCEVHLSILNKYIFFQNVFFSPIIKELGGYPKFFFTYETYEITFVGDILWSVAVY